MPSALHQILERGDINIYQQRTPRIWKVQQEKEKSLKDALKNIDGFEEAIATYDQIDINDVQCVLDPAPYVADKIDLHKDKLWSEFLRLIGVSNLSYQKKERNISDEIQAMQGGTIASRYSRFEPRKRAVDEINEKFAEYLDGKKIEVKYYDGLPTSKEEFEQTFEDIDEESEENV